MKVLRIEPYKTPFVREIDPGLESLQHEVCGWIEAVYPFDDPVAIICNEEGKINGMELCRAVRDEDGEVVDVIAGSFLVVGCGKENFDSLSEEMIEKYQEVFAQPEVFIQTNSNLLVLPYVTDHSMISDEGGLER